jgi:heme-degrading monooxygenase HmoA/diadenosine tetraphosphate (Ap4A) HIT family hydrolase
MTTLIHERVRLAREGRNPYVIARLDSGWVVIGDVQPLPGYCLLLPDPVVGDLNALSEIERTLYNRDVVRVGDALLHLTGARRINYETWGNADEALHTHIMPRYTHEPNEKRRLPACVSYDWKSARPFHSEDDRPFVEAMRAYLTGNADSTFEGQAAKNFYDALNRNDALAAVALFDPHAVRAEWEGTPNAQVLHGVDAIVEHITQGRGTWAEGHCLPERFVAVGNKLVVFVHVQVRLKEGEKWIEGRVADVFTFENGKIVGFRSIACGFDALVWAGAVESTKKHTQHFVTTALETAEKPASTLLAATPEPPYYAVIFTSLRAEPAAATQNGTGDGYSETAARMLALATKQTGFLGVDSARSEVGITVSYWRDLDSIQAWRNEAEHTEARKRGRESWYSAFSVRIALVDRAYGRGP